MEDGNGYTSQAAVRSLLKHRGDEKALEAMANKWQLALLVCAVDNSGVMQLSFVALELDYNARDRKSVVITYYHHGEMYNYF